MDKLPLHVLPTAHLKAVVDGMADDALIKGACVASNDYIFN